jgi:predicted enzyme related to lactoylglutathione lyase
MSGFIRKRFVLRLPVYKEKNWNYPYDNHIIFDKQMADPLQHMPHNGTSVDDWHCWYHVELDRIFGPWNNRYHLGDAFTGAHDIPANITNYVPHLNSYEEFMALMMTYHEYRVANVKFKVQTKFPRNPQIATNLAMTGASGIEGFGTWGIEGPTPNPYIEFAYPQDDQATLGLQANYLAMNMHPTDSLTTAEQQAVMQKRYPDAYGMRQMKGYRRIYLKGERTYTFPINFLHIQYNLSRAERQEYEGAPPILIKSHNIPERAMNKQKRWMRCRDTPRSMTTTPLYSGRENVKMIEWDKNYSTLFKISNLPTLRAQYGNTTADDIEKLVQFYVVVDLEFRGKKRMYIGDAAYHLNLKYPEPVGTAARPHQSEELFEPSQGTSFNESANKKARNEQTDGGSQVSMPEMVFNKAAAIADLAGNGNISGVISTGARLINIVQSYA